MRKAVFVLSLGCASAFQLPFSVPFLYKKESSFNAQVDLTPRVAIIGAGAGGSSAAFWISKAKERFGVDVEIDVYEKEPYIGGRSTTIYPYNNKTLPPIELGASIFVKPNKNLWRATDEFNLTRYSFEDDDAPMGVWDGQKILLTVGSGWWDKLKVMWRYGPQAPYRTDKLVKAMVNELMKVYAEDCPRWDNISSLASQLGYSDLVSQSAADYFDGQGVAKQFTRELIEAATRVNYGQNIDDIHALEGSVSLAADNAVSVEGGNFKIFEHFLERSGAHVFLNTTIESIKPQAETSHHWTVCSSQGSTSYKAVILAAPFHSTGIEVPPHISSQIPEQPYVHLHVTLLSTTSRVPNADYFSAGPEGVPTVLLTTYEGVRQGGVEPEFNSLSYLKLLRDGDGVPPEWAVKIFSHSRISDEWLNNMFYGQVGWVFRKEWDAYPKLPPTTSFPPIKLDKGFFYVNAFEPFISTMETETVASRNVVDLLLNEEFGSSICAPLISGSEGPKLQRPLAFEEHFVYGWDC